MGFLGVFFVFFEWVFYCQPCCEVAGLLVELKQAVRGGGVLLSSVHADCVEEWVLSQLQQLATTVVAVERETSKRVYPKICSVTHRWGTYLINIIIFFFIINSSLGFWYRQTRILG